MRPYLAAGLSWCRTQYDGSVLGSILVHYVLEVHGFQTPEVPKDSRVRDSFERPKVLVLGSYIQYAYGSRRKVL